MPSRLNWILFPLLSLVLAALVLVPGITARNVNLSDLSLLGIAADESPFSQFVQVPLDGRSYPSDYVVKSDKPFIIEIDYHSRGFVNKSEAEQAACDFVDAILPDEMMKEITLGDTVEGPWGLLPRWSFEFLNNSITTYKEAAALVEVNALSGEIIRYFGVAPFSVLSIQNESSAIGAITAFAESTNISIPTESRYLTYHQSEPTREYGFAFIQSVGPIPVDPSIGVVSFEIEMRNGGRFYFSFDWVPILDIPTEGIKSPEISSETDYQLVLTQVPADIDPLTVTHEFRLCWVLPPDIAQGPPYEGTVIDAFNGDIVESIPYNISGSGGGLGLLHFAIIAVALCCASLAHTIDKNRLMMKLRQNHP